ncbi:histidine phosphatase family protein [Aristophania vespae]|uniref:Histidine phosphatase family protein n=1 Tax=Aristophania vespae TaxID=2697033 RepID=A0A6P1NI47_9PROT|nr:histidine phosphatase family protein [Aristophania vespae]QHI96204.1 histidine phosphatase family protein [Aristophania vespae]
MTQLVLRPYWFLRHGETDWNARSLSQGRTNVPLNAKGLAQAATAGKAFARHFENEKIAFTHIICSPLDRARVTAEHVQRAISEAGGPHLPLTCNEDILEVSFGEQEGLPMGEWYNPWIAGEYTPKGAEPFADLRERAVRGVNKAIADADPGMALIVAHGGIFRALRSAMGLEPNIRLPNAVPVYAYPENGKWHLKIEGEFEA